MKFPRTFPRCSSLAGVLLCFFLSISSRMVLAAPSGPATGRSDFPTFGVSVIPPAGWRQAADTPMGQIARWERGGGKQPVRASLVMEIEPTTKRTLAQRVAQLEKQFRGKVLDKHILLDGMPAVRMKFPGSTELPRHIVLVTQRTAHTYLLEMHAAMDANAEGAWHTLYKSWKWIPCESPAGHLQFAAQPVSLFDGMITFQVPAILRTFPNGFQTQAKLAVVDNRTDIMALDIDAQVLPNPTRLTLDQWKDRFAAQIQQMLKLTTPVVWKEHAGKTSLFLTDDLQPNITQPTDPRAHIYSMQVRYTLVPINEDRLILIGFSVTVPSEEERKVFEATVDRMIDSITIVSSTPVAPAGKTG